MRSFLFTIEVSDDTKQFKSMRGIINKFNELSNEFIEFKAGSKHVKEGENIWKLRGKARSEYELDMFLKKLIQGEGIKVIKCSY